MTVATGDVNGDGFSDLVAGADGWGTVNPPGFVYVFHSTGSDGVTITAAASASRIITGEGTSNLLGYSVATGDVNGDGYADVWAGAYGYSSYTGRAYVFHSTGGGGVSITAAGSASTVITGEGTNSQFGYSVAGGN